MDGLWVEPLNTPLLRAHTVLVMQTLVVPILVREVLSEEKLSLQLPVGLPINPSFRRIANTVLRSNLACLFSQTTIGGETNFLTLEFFGFIENLFQLAFKYSCVFFTSSVLVRVS